jgi:DUF2911 family protein
MKKAIAFVLILQLFFISLLAQTSAVPAVDKSPMDMSYYPANYPSQKIQDKVTDPLALRVIYSRPQKAARPIFGELVKYGEVWRLGANEATEIEFFKQVRIGGKKINKGRYTLYAIPGETSWTIIVNKDTDTWGSFKYDAKKDVVKTIAPVQKTDAIVEFFSMQFEKTPTGCNLVISWDRTQVAVPIIL